MKVKGWHFVGDTLRDGRPVPRDGELLTHKGPVDMYVSGLHASRRIIDALRYARGSVVCRVELLDVVQEGDGKVVGAARRIIWRVDARYILPDFARRCALDVVHLWSPPQVVSDYLRGGKERWRDAALAAAEAADEAVETAAETAAVVATAEAIAWATARDVAWAVEDAALAAAEAAAEAAARDAEADAWAATWADARDAALADARARQNRRLTAMVSARRTA